MATVDKLLKLLQKDIVDELSEEELTKIAQDVLIGYKIDEDSRSAWLETNQEAMRIIKHCESNIDDDGMDTPVYKAAKVIYPLLAPAVIQLASRMIQHVVRNDRVAECAVLGQDQQVPEDPQAFQQYQQMMQAAQQNPQLQQQMQQVPQPNMVWKKKDRAKRVSDFMSYEFLIESDSWLKDTHKLMHIVASWGTGFRQVTYDPVMKRNRDDLINPEDVIINHGLSCLEKVRRVTIRHSLTLNEIVEQTRAGYFSLSDEDLEKLQVQPNTDEDESIQEINPVHTVYCQTTYIDLDDDGYAEPWKVYVHEGLQKVLGIYPAFEVDDIVCSEQGEIQCVKLRLDIVDFHLIDDPEGKFYSIGLNYLLLHQNKSITSILRQLLDAGSMSNASSCTGFVTNAFRTQDSEIEIELGQFSKLELTNPNINPMQHVIPLPVKEPSQVLLALLQLLIQGGEKTGFITDVLTGDIQGQNVPATTMLAMVEQGTRAFKPVIQKLWSSLRKEFKLWFHLHSKYLDEAKYVAFQDSVVQVSKEDFNEKDMDIVPVADPTQSSECHKYAKMQMIVQLLGTQAIAAMNVQECLLELFKGAEFDTPDRFVAQPQPQAPDPKLLEVQMKGHAIEMQNQVDQLKLQLEGQKIQNEQLKTQIKAGQLKIQATESQAVQQKLVADAHKGMAEANVKDRMARVAEKQTLIEQQKVDVMRIQAQNKKNSDS